jgi:hypothetical protein
METGRHSSARHLQQLTRTITATILAGSITDITCSSYSVIVVLMESLRLKELALKRVNFSKS